MLYGDELWTECVECKQGVVRSYKVRELVDVYMQGGMELIIGGGKRSGNLDDQG